MLRAAGTGGMPWAGSGSYAQMKALGAVADGATFTVTSYASFTPRAGQTWRYSAANTDWFPVAPALVYESTALLNGLVQTAAQILLAMPVDAGVLTGKSFVARHTAAKSGTTDTLTSTVRMGSAGTTSDASVVALLSLTGTNRSIGGESWFRMASSTSVQRLGGSPGAVWANLQTGGLANAAVTVADVTSANYVSISCTMSGTTDTPQLGYTALLVMP